MVEYGRRLRANSNLRGDMDQTKGGEMAQGLALAIPDPRINAIPDGWATNSFAALADTLEWDDLDEAEARLRGLASYIESLGADHVELQKALRIVEFRRGVLMDPEVSKGGRSDLSMRGKVEDVAPATASRYRQIARHWNSVVWPHLLGATELRDVSQAAVLRLIEGAVERRREEERLQDRKAKVVAVLKEISRIAPGTLVSPTGMVPPPDLSRDAWWECMKLLATLIEPEFSGELAG
jgi:hypothetical protein